MKCKYCGAEIANDSVYCEQCGKFTNPYNKKGVTCSMSLVKWLLFGTMAVLCASTLFFGVYVISHWIVDSVLLISTWWIIPFLSLVIFVVSLVLSLRKKLSWFFTIVMFLLLGANTTEYFVSCSSFGSNIHEVLYMDVPTSNGGVYFTFGDEIHANYSYEILVNNKDAVVEALSLSRGDGYDDYYMNKEDGRVSFNIGIYERYETTCGDSGIIIFIVSIVKTGIILMYIIYSIIAASIARKRIRRG